MPGKILILLFLGEREHSIAHNHLITTHQPIQIIHFAPLKTKDIHLSVSDGTQFRSNLQYIFLSYLIKTIH
jgi:hypothetical protein